MTSKIQELLNRNEQFVAAGNFNESIMPSRIPAFLVCCIDPRVEPSAVLGVELFDMPIIRNVGGRVTEAVIEDIRYISFLVDKMIPEGDLFEVAIVHHTQCGSLFLLDDGFRSAYSDHSGRSEEDLLGIPTADPLASLRLDVERLRRAQGISPRISVGGYFHNLEEGTVTMVIEPASPYEEQ
jgi:carbonic anhydrase